MVRVSLSRLQKAWEYSRMRILGRWSTYEIEPAANGLSYDCKTDSSKDYAWEEVVARFRGQVIEAVYIGTWFETADAFEVWLDWEMASKQ